MLYDLCHRVLDRLLIGNIRTDAKSAVLIQAQLFRSAAAKRLVNIQQSRLRTLVCKLFDDCGTHSAAGAGYNDHFVSKAHFVDPPCSLKWQ